MKSTCHLKFSPALWWWKERGLSSQTERVWIHFDHWVAMWPEPVIWLFFLNFGFIYLFWLCWVFTSVWGPSLVGGKRGPLFIAVRGLLTIAASPVAEHRLQMRRLSNCGSWAQLLHGIWDLPRPGLEPVSPALAGRLSTTAPPGKPSLTFLNFSFLIQQRTKRNPI